MPKISVIVPVYKVEKYLNRCVDSILNQTFKDFELILVDDGSPDNCPTICDDYAAKYDFVHVIHKENGGLSDARNYGIDWAFHNSDSEWITFIDSDDWVHKQYLEILLNVAEDKDLDVIVCNYDSVFKLNEVFNNQITDPKTEVIVSELIFSDDYYRFANCAWAKLYRKMLFEQLRYPFGKLYEDGYITPQIMMKYENTTIVNAPLYHYFINYNGITRSKPNAKSIADHIDANMFQMHFCYENGLKNPFEYCYSRCCYDIIYKLFMFRDSEIRKIIIDKKNILFAFSKKEDLNKKGLSFYEKYNNTLKIIKTELKRNINSEYKNKHNVKLFSLVKCFLHKQKELLKVFLFKG